MIRTLISLVIILAGSVLAGCSTINLPTGNSTGLPVPGATPEVRPSANPLTPEATFSMLVLPTDTPTQPSPESTQLAPPGPTLEVLDFRNYFPPAPAGLGKVANHIVFYSNRSGKYQLYQMNLDGSNVINLTNNPNFDIYDMEPAWSSDGKIAFTNQVNGKWEIFVLSPNQRIPVQLTDWGADSWSLSWSPDGKYLAFVTNKDLMDEIYVIPAEGGEPLNISRQPTANDFSPVWSPDGQSILFVSDREEGGNQDIYIMKADGSGVTRLTTDQARDTSPSWSPDGKQIAFVSDREQNFEVYVMDAPQGIMAKPGEPTRLTRTPAYEWSPVWSPDGKWIAFTSLRDDKENYEVYIMAPDGSNQTRLTNDPADDIIPRWWP